MPLMSACHCLAHEVNGRSKTTDICEPQAQGRNSSSSSARYWAHSINTKWTYQQVDFYLCWTCYCYCFGSWMGGHYFVHNQQRKCTSFPGGSWMDTTFFCKRGCLHSLYILWLFRTAQALENLEGLVKQVTRCSKKLWSWNCKPLEYI